jgi:hypothetical protein
VRTQNLVAQDGEDPDPTIPGPRQGFFERSLVSGRLRQHGQRRVIRVPRRKYPDRTCIRGRVEISACRWHRTLALGDGAGVGKGESRHCTLCCAAQTAHTRTIANKQARANGHPKMRMLAHTDLCRASDRCERAATLERRPQVCFFCGFVGLAKSSSTHCAHFEAFQEARGMLPHRRRAGPVCCRRILWVSISTDLKYDAGRDETRSHPAARCAVSCMPMAHC